MKPKIIHFSPTYTKENGLQMVDFKNLPLPTETSFTEQSLVTIPPGQTGGNHKHPRIEAFVAFGKGMEFHWIDEDGVVQKQSMVSDSELLLFVVPPLLPHAVVNTSPTEQGILLEFANESQHDVERVEVV